MSKRKQLSRKQCAVAVAPRTADSSAVYVLYDIQDSPSEGVIAIMNKEGDKRVYQVFLFLLVHQFKYADLGPFKIFPISLQYRRGQRRKKIVGVLQHAVVSRKYYRYESG